MDVNCMMVYVRVERQVNEAYDDTMEKEKANQTIQ